MPLQYTCSIDQSTTSTKFSLYTIHGALIDQELILHQQVTPSQGWLQHDPTQILHNTFLAVTNVLKRHSQIALQSIAGVGLCNQRQTIICWDCESGLPLYNAIVWSDSRTTQICKQFQKKHGCYKERTGLPVSTYFSLFKIIWLLENVPNIKDNEKVRFGTVDTWIAYKLTGEFVTDSSNASRTHLFDIHHKRWDPELLAAVGISQKQLARVVGSFQEIGVIKEGMLKGQCIRSIMGDQQSSAYAHHLKENQLKITYGTGCFILSNIGEKPFIHPAFLTTILWTKGAICQYGIQASVQCGAGIVNWAKALGLFHDYQELNQLPDCPEELMFMPSFGSIFAPFWKGGISGSFLGLSHKTTRQHLLASILQAIAFRVYDNIVDSTFSKINKIIADGGMTKNPRFMQMQADLFGIPVEVRELDTCWGAARGVMTSLGGQYKEQKEVGRIYNPSTDPQLRHPLNQKYKKWCMQRKKQYNNNI